MTSAGGARDGDGTKMTISKMAAGDGQDEES